MPECLLLQYAYTVVTSVMQLLRKLLKDQVPRKICYFGFNSYVKKSFSATMFRILWLLKSRFDVEKAQNSDLDP